MSLPQPNHEFKTTRWSMVVAARGATESALRQDSLAELCRQYWYPLFAYLRRKGHSTTDAADYVQGFFTELIDKDFLDAVQPDSGRFRWFLMSAIGRFVSKHHQQARAQKRGGNVTTFSFDVQNAEQRYQLEPVQGWTAEKLFDRRWALQVLQSTLGQLSEEYRARSQSELFQALQPTLTVDGQTETYQQVAQRMGMTEGAVKVAAHRMRQRYRDVLRQTVAETVADPGGVDDELDILLTALRG